MPRYLCGNPQHAQPVNVTGLVLAERNQSSEYVWVVLLDDLLNYVEALTEVPHTGTRFLKIVERVTGRDRVEGGGRVVVLPQQSAETPYGLYDLPTLVRLNPDIESLKYIAQRVPPRVLDRSDSVFLLMPDQSEIASAIRQAGGGERDCAVIIPKERDTDTAGIYSVEALANVMAPLGMTRDQLKDAVTTLPNDIGSARRESSEWIVLIECPFLEGTPPTSHKTVFEGPAGAQPETNIGRPASGRELALEKAGEEDLASRKSIERLQERLKFVLTGEALITVFLTGAGWLTDNLSAAVRNEPESYIEAVFLFAASVVVAVIGTSIGAARRINVNDLAAVQRAYSWRVGLMTACVVVATILYAAAVLAAVIPSVRLADREPSIPTPTISFDGSSLPTTVTVSGVADNLRIGSARSLIVRGFGNGVENADSAEGVLLLRERGQADITGKISFQAKLPVALGFTSLTAQIADPSEKPATCTPHVDVDGCTVASIPPSATETIAAPSVSLEAPSQQQPPKITIEGTWNGLTTDMALGLSVRSYAETGSADARTLLRQILVPDSSGKAAIKTTIPLPSGFGWITVQAWNAEDEVPACSPTEESVQSGCVVIRGLG